ncbi:MAG: CotH kinase family protein [Lachnospiraceae bacterium]|nr:CotH kinase family protein [Lachnospiraceae bacterium]
MFKKRLFIFIILCFMWTGCGTGKPDATEDSHALAQETVLPAKEPETGPSSETEKAVDGRLDSYKESPYSSEWTSDDLYHWHEASDGSGHVKDKGGHVFVIGTLEPSGQAYGDFCVCRYCGKIITPGASKDNVRAPSFTAAPESPVFAKPGQALTLSCHAGRDTGTVLYQWYESSDASLQGGHAIRGATGPDLTFPDGAEKGIRYYYCLAVSIEEKNGKILMSKKARSRAAAVTCTGIPMVTVETSDGKAPTASKEKHKGRLRIYYPDGTVYDSNEWLSDGDFEIHVHGNATVLFPKHPYKLKLPKKADLIDPSSGKDKDKEWVLLANYSDKTLLRNQTGFYVSSLFNGILGNERLYVPNARFVDVVLNGEYLGVYTLADQVKEGKARGAVNEKESDPGGIGFVAEYEYNYYRQEPKWFLSERQQYPYTFKYPKTDDENFDEHMAYFRDYIEEFEEVLYEDESDAWTEYIDVESFARWFLTHNITASFDTNLFFTKKTSDNTSKLVMGPVWDFEWSFGIGWYDGARPRDPAYRCTDYWYFEELLTRPEFVLELSRQWEELNRTYLDLAGVITGQMDAFADEISVAQQLNFRKWKILDKKISAGAMPMGSYEAELEVDRAFVQNRLEWVDGMIRDLKKEAERTLMKAQGKPWHIVLPYKLQYE